MSILNNSNAISSKGYFVNSSLRFRGFNSTRTNEYDTVNITSGLATAFRSDGDTTRWTWSGWIKLSMLMSSGSDPAVLFSGVESATDYTYIYIDPTTYSLSYYNLVGATSIDRNTVQVLQDPSAWYHIVVAYNSNEAVDADRLKFYINGVRITNYTGTNTTISSAKADAINGAWPHYIGAFPVPSPKQYFDGYMSEVNFIADQALDADSFGDFDTYNIWRPKKYTGTYGDNGFYLPFKQDPTASKFRAVSYTGVGSEQSISKVGFSPDFIWLKKFTSNLIASASNLVFDIIRGPTANVKTNSSAVESIDANGVLSFDSDGFTVGTSALANDTDYPYVAFCWDLGGTTSANTDGTISSSVRASTETGVSVVTYTGNGVAGATVGHGLGSAPSLIWIKNRDSSQSWVAGSDQLIDWSRYLLAFLGPQATDSTVFDSTAPTSTVFSIGTSARTNTNGDEYVAFCFSSVAGFSEIGTYTGTGDTASNTGPTITTGFKPAFVMVQRLTPDGGTQNARTALFTNTLAPSNTVDEVINPAFASINTSGDDYQLRFTDTGFSILTATGTNAVNYMNEAGEDYLYIAFADTVQDQFNLDQSGNKNDFNATAINNYTTPNDSGYDLMTDVPTNTSENTGNFATLSYINSRDGFPPEAGALTLPTTSSGAITYPSTIAIPRTGKWYFEYKWTDGTGAVGIVTLDGEFIDSDIPPTYSYTSSGTLPSGSGSAWISGDIIGTAYDADANTIEFYKNNVSQGSSSVTDDEYYFAVRKNSTGSGAVNFGQRPFTYTPPAGYKPLNTFNMPLPSILEGKKYMDALLYTGNGATQSITGLDFAPNLVWIKQRSSPRASHALYDTIRGVTKEIQSDLIAQELTQVDGLTAFNSDGFDLGSRVIVNGNSETYVSWNWRASDSAPASNTDGTITSTVSANTSSGFSIVTYTGTGANATVGHGLGLAPEMIIFKNRETAFNWPVYHKYVVDLDPETDYLTLNTTDAFIDDDTIWNDTAPTSTVFSLGTMTRVNENTKQIVAYCFASIEGFSKINYYIGNGLTNGPFIYTGFKPEFFMIKRTTGSTSSWRMYDAERRGYNSDSVVLVANRDDIESTSPGDNINLLSNGFKILDLNNGLNANGARYIYIAFAKNPFKISLAK